MMSSTKDTLAPKNRLLAALTPADLARLWPRLEPIDFGLRHVMARPGDPIAAVYFPETGWVSMVAQLADGNSAEVGLIGHEGMLGLSLLLGASTEYVESMVQGPGTMLRLGAKEFRQALVDIPSLMPLLLRYSLAFQDQVTQTAACNGHHALDQRLARWLLMAHDRAVQDDFAMTQDFLALMLCVHRPGVTVAARLFQQAGLIQYGQGHMTIKNRPALEASACECYGAVRTRYDALFGKRTG